MYKQLLLWALRFWCTGISSLILRGRVVVLFKVLMHINCYKTAPINIAKVRGFVGHLIKLWPAQSVLVLTSDLHKFCKIVEIEGN